MSQIQFEEGATGFVTLVFTDQDGDSVVPDSATYTLFNKKTKATINDRTAISIPGLAATVDLELLPADNPIIDDKLDVEEHVLFVEWVYSTTRLGKKEITFDVINLVKIT